MTSTLGPIAGISATLNFQQAEIERLRRQVEEQQAEIARLKAALAAKETA
ncbi:hypothetical protein GTW25_02715 [Aliihoeflea aestuarii]|nr:hypothetical protein [Aliihoeflea aestuarii]MCO6389940.1 hypothetical protein [Aliihoeflea aestuarii]